jgi:Holliday junction resolvase YEN1
MDLVNKEKQKDMLQIVTSTLFLCTCERCQAPGEAEAELAWLNAIGVIDAVLTEDSDAFLFGATHVIRARFVATPRCLTTTDSKFSTLSKTNDTVKGYSVEQVEEDPGISLLREGMILMALLVGNDYDTVSPPPAFLMW